MKKTVLYLLVLALLACCFCVSAEEAETPTAPAYDLDHLVVGNTTALSGHFMTQLFGNNTSDADAAMLLNGYNLIRWNYGLGNFETDPSVVEGLSVVVNTGDGAEGQMSPEEVEGSCTYVLRLSEDMRYSDGTPITAADYAFSILLNSSPEARAIGGNANGYDAMLGISQYQSGERQEISGLRIRDTYVLSLTVSKDYRPFFYELGLLRCYPLPIHVIAPGCTVKDDGNGAYIDGPFTAELLEETLLDPAMGYVSHPSVVSGPYRLLSYDPAAYVAEFEINDEYKGNYEGATPSIRRLTLKPAVNAAMIGELASGDFGLLDKCLDAQAIREGLSLIGSGSYSMSAFPRSGMSFLSFNCEKEIDGRTAVRQAVACCLDKDETVSLYTGNTGIRVDGYYGIAQWMYQVVSGAANPPVAELADNASEAETAAYEAELDKWDELSLDSVKVYPFDPEEAVRLLEADGWTLNRDGDPFVPGTDDVRCRMENGNLQALNLTLIYPEGNRIGEILEQTFLPGLQQAGIGMTIQPVAWQQLLRQYYRQEERTCDMIYLASNFNEVFNPWPVFDPADADVGAANYSGIKDEALAEAAMDLSRTEPGDNYGYVVNWITMQERFAEALPMIPVYSNVYYDFFTSQLQNFIVQQNITWSEAIVAAYMAEPQEPGADSDFDSDFDSEFDFE